MNVCLKIFINQETIPQMVFVRYYLMYSQAHSLYPYPFPYFLFSPRFIIPVCVPISLVSEFPIPVQRQEKTLKEKWSSHWVLRLGMESFMSKCQ